MIIESSGYVLKMNIQQQLRGTFRLVSLAFPVRRDRPVGAEARLKYGCSGHQGLLLALVRVHGHCRERQLAKLKAVMKLWTVVVVTNQTIAESSS